MAGPITWRNIGGGGGGSATALLSLGNQQVQQSFNALQDIFKNEARLQEKNSAAVQANNTAKYLDAVNAAGLDGLQDPEQRAALEAERAGYGAAIDRNATRGAIDNRVANLQKQTVAANQFQDQATEREQRYIIDHGLELARSGDAQGVAKLLDDTKFLNEGKVTTDLMGVLDARTRRGYAAEDQARQGRAETRQIAQFQESMAAAAENRIIRNEERQDRNEQRQFQRGAKVLDDASNQAKEILNTRLQGNEWSKTSDDPAKDAAVLLGGAKGLKNFESYFNSDSTDYKQMQTGVTELLSKGIEVDGEIYKVPPAILQQVINSHSNNWNVFDNPMDAIRSELKDSLSGNKGAGNRAKVRDAQDARAAANNFMQTVKRAKTHLGSSSTLDTSGIVSALAELAGNKPVTSPKSNPNLLPGPDEDIPDSWPPKGQVLNIQ
ncbi:hypothetical protein HOT57_gp08 [Pseudomonas phage phCDa]|uniref:Uncharacterized protein n=1 Tax=Pseudomonas phage phCDa TaxID=2268587 RepID=A0A2Z5HAB1_9CAUD|nr:hypothetical protein HOT57_gp08 [Pseudomonas phage phCDa]AXC36452.1 hypothetical protein phCDa_8 [Pseudomonas phage phCDa]